MTRTSQHAERARWPAGRPGEPRRGRRGWTPRLEDLRRRQMRSGCRGLRVDSPVFGAAIEVSPGGLRIQSGSPLAAGSRYVFRLNYGTRFLHLPGRVVWCRPDRMEVTPYGGRVIYQTGVELRSGQPDGGWQMALADRAHLTVGA